MMNKKAEDMNLRGTKFFNPHGLPGDTPEQDNVSTPEDMALIAGELLKYPQVVEWASTWSCAFGENRPKPMIITNHNHLIKDCLGVDGMKTGFIKRSGFCSAITCKREGRRFIAVVTGFPDYKTRDTFVTELLDWGYKQNTDCNSFPVTKKGEISSE
jgi:D-alanyl-D-alanine carboxypeptidase (penicillin-binding protein 5/6)